jgi:transposase
MPTRLATDVVVALEHELTAAGPSISNCRMIQLANNYRTTYDTVRRHKNRILSGQPLPARTGGQRRVITPEMDRSIYCLLNKFPWFYQDEIAQFLYEVYDIRVCQGSISYALARLKLTKKKLKIEAAQRNEELRTAWQDYIQTFSADQLVFVDESGSDERTGDRSYGWALSGVEAKVSRWLESKDRISALLAYSLDAYIAGITFPGTCDADIFESFLIDELLPKCNPYPLPRSVIVLDNASCHHKHRQRLEAACAARGVWLRFLPPYSPDFNPIEESFNDLKAYIRRWYRAKIAHFPDYQAFLEWALRQVGSGSTARVRARAHFRNAGIDGVPDD